MSAAVQTQQEARRYLCTVKPEFACHNFTLKIKRFDLEPFTQTRRVRRDDGMYDEVEEKRHYYRAIDLPVNQRIFSGPDDEVGTLQIGAVHELTEQEVEYLREVEIPRYVVRWQGKYRPPANKPEKRGVGPNGSYVRGHVIATMSSEGRRDHRYRARRDDEPIAGYITIQPLIEDQRGVRRADDFAVVGGLADQQVALHKERSRLETLEAELKRREAEIEKREAEMLAQAEADEDESLSTPKGRAVKRNQARKKRRG